MGRTSRSFFARQATVQSCGTRESSPGSSLAVDTADDCGNRMDRRSWPARNRGKLILLLELLVELLDKVVPADARPCLAGGADVNRSLGPGRKLSEAPMYLTA